MRMVRAPRTAALVMAGAAVLALVGLWLARAPLATLWLNGALAAAGLEGEGAVADIGPHGLKLSALRLGPSRAPGVSAKKIDVTFRLDELLLGRLRAVALDELELRLSVDAGGLRVAGIPAQPSRGAEKKAATPPPLPQLEARNVRVFVQTPAGELVGDGALDGGPGTGWRLEAELLPAYLGQGEAALELVEGRLKGEVTPTRASLEAAIELADLESKEAQAARARLDVSLTGEMADLARLETLAVTGSAVFALAEAKLRDPAAAASALNIALPEGVLADLLGPHLATLREAAAAAMAGFDVAASLEASVADGVIALGSRTPATLTAKSGFKAAFDAPKGSVQLRSFGRRIAAKALRAEARGGGAPDSVALLDDAAVDLSGRAPAVAAAGTARVGPWVEDGLSATLDLGAIAVALADGALATDVTGQAAIEGQRKDAALKGVKLDGNLRIEANAGKLAVKPRSDAPLGLLAQGVAMGDFAVVDVAAKLAPYPGADAILTSSAQGVAFAAFLTELDATAPAAGGRARLRAPSTELKLDLPANGDGRASVRAQGPRVNFQRDPAQPGPNQGEAILEIRVADANLRLTPDATGLDGRFEGFTITGAGSPLHVADGAGEGEAALRPGGVVDGRFAIARAELRHNASPALVAPLRFAGDLKLEAGRGSGQATASLAGGQELMAASLGFDPAAKTLQLDFRSPRLAFSPGGLQPQAIAPILRGKLADARGGVRVEGGLTLRPDGLASRAEIAVEDLDFDTLAGKVIGLRSTFRLADLLNLKSDGVQEVRIGGLDFGVPIEGGTIKVELKGGGAALVHDATFPFAGGEVSLEPMEWIPGDVDQRGALAARDIDLAQLLVLFAVPDLEASGVVSGRMPVIFSDKGVYIDNAQLSSRAEGVIRYTGVGAQALAVGTPEAKLTADALKNFEYSTLGLSLNGPLDGDMKLVVSTLGRNPSLLDGKAIRLTTTVDAQFARLLINASRSLDARQRVRDAIEAQKRN